ncbi:Hemerythrin HHE cation binding domain-containing protein [Rhizobium sp. RU20A]|uniref:hemerythrin domain-containing protein n=1 Tax=Rhizobium sp. RU20A TaxID=1907412 RepID=UPI000955A0E5|nr:hemerythrin domain-containing protein [Rhizobium sp. RU20A]SIQ15626.1 Hemerythrin HHE cation binding domain-containing protein [Rhizobium sp. RU20A]
MASFNAPAGTPHAPAAIGGPPALSLTESLKQLDDIHREKLAVCDQLEAIADSLPSDVNRQRCLYAAKAIAQVVRAAHRFEETTIFPAIASHFPDVPHLESTLRRLQFEHCEDEGFADELSDALHRLAAADPRVHPETIGYMLRGFFTTVRRHIAFEREHLIGAVNGSAQMNP